MFFERVCCERDRRFSPKERKQTDNPRQGWEDGTPPPHRDFKERSSVVLAVAQKERKKTGNPRAINK